MDSATVLYAQNLDFNCPNLKQFMVARAISVARIGHSTISF